MRISPYKMLFEFSELDWLFQDSEDIDSFLNRIIELVFKHMNTSGCSIYLIDRSSDHLIFMASEQTITDSDKEIDKQSFHRQKEDDLCGKAIESGKIEYESKSRL
ncbi:MAG: hypothetical protein PQJ46_13710, partial [Spirochaetales bacterium]|nr:hypothetical protein [Spirochaetales bacterium]